jgi:uncharacterized protein YdeI (YjbR/CyaY-like superfamily)
MTVPRDSRPQPTFFATPAELRAWLEAHHDSAPELLVGFHKVASGKPSVTWPEAVDEALCYGWIDGVRRSIDAASYTIRFTSRKPGSTWSVVNVRRAPRADRRRTDAPRGAEGVRGQERRGLRALLV